MWGHFPPRIPSTHPNLQAAARRKGLCPGRASALCIAGRRRRMRREDVGERRGVDEGGRGGHGSKGSEEEMARARGKPIS